MDFLKKVYSFFASPDTPGSGFYMALLPLISSVGDYFLGSGNPVLMGIGGGIAAIYAAAHAIGNGMAAKHAPTPAAASVPTVNDTPFGVPKIGPDAVPASTLTRTQQAYHDALLAPVPPAPPPIVPPSANAADVHAIIADLQATTPPAPAPAPFWQQSTPADPAEPAGSFTAPPPTVDETAAPAPAAEGDADDPRHAAPAEKTRTA